MAHKNSQRAVCVATLLPLFVGSSASSTQAACIDLWARSWSAPHNKTSQKSEFHLNEQFVLCVRVASDAFVSIWDQPPRGSPSRLFPNVFTHKSDNARTRAGKLQGEMEHCFGMSDTFPLFFPSDQGQGSGVLSVFATTSVEDQPALEDYEVPGDRIRRERMDQLARSYRSDANICGSKMKAYFDYRITK